MATARSANLLSRLDAQTHARTDTQRQPTLSHALHLSPTFLACTNRPNKQGCFDFFTSQGQTCSSSWLYPQYRRFSLSYPVFVRRSTAEPPPSSLVFLFSSFPIARLSWPKWLPSTFRWSRPAGTCRQALRHPRTAQALRPVSPSNAPSSSDLPSRPAALCPRKPAACIGPLARH